MEPINANLLLTAGLGPRLSLASGPEASSKTGALRLVARLGVLLVARDGGERGKTPPSSTTAPRALEPAFKRAMTFVFLGTKGGANRIRIVKLLKDEALNANKIGERLDLDYKTVQHHLEILEENKVVVSSSPKGTYGALYFLSQNFETHLELIEEMWVRFGRK